MSDLDQITILIVDDDEVDLRAAYRSLRKHGIANPIVTAENGAEALALLKGTERSALTWPYIVLLDINMPQMSGFELLSHVRDDPELHRTPVFMLTSSPDQRDVNRAYDHQVAGYIVKTDVGPGLNRLVAIVEHYIETIRFPDRC